MDTEMTCPLTSGDDHSTRSRSTSPVPTDRMSSFQSARERNVRMNVNHVPLRIGPGPVPVPVPGTAGGSTSRAQGLTPNTWRQSDMASSSSPSAVPFYPHPPAQYNPNSPMIGSHPGNRAAFMMGENNVPLSSVRPGAVWPTSDQLDTSYAYGIRRNDGSVTRLLRADEFPTANIPPRQGPEGLIILPAPKQPAPNRNTPERMVSMEVVRKLPPTTFVPQRPEHSMRSVSHDPTQQHIDSIVQSSSVTPPVRRREKIYCDKWIHEGVCAFTQMGCKYKHEMPHDLLTQQSLGLNHGLPAWYRRMYAIDLHPSSSPTHPTHPMSTPPSNGKRIEGPWRRDEGLQGNRGHRGHHGPSSMGGNMQLEVHGNHRSAFGPIAPPPQMQSYFNNNNNNHNNPYSALEAEESEEEDDDEMIYPGRKR